MAELEFNHTIIGGPADKSFPSLSTAQFQSALSANALRALPVSLSDSIQQAYVMAMQINSYLDQRRRMDRSLGHISAAMFRGTQNVRNEIRAELKTLLPQVIDGLERALGASAADEEK